VTAAFAFLQQTKKSGMNYRMREKNEEKCDKDIKQSHPEHISVRLV
jgi:hypothetical protein